MMILSTNWATAWLMTGIGFGVVFCILVLLVFILQIFNATANAAKKTAPAPVKQQETAAQPVAAPVSEDDKAAVAMALYLYYRNVHDEESNVLTIQPAAYSSWHSILNTRL